MGFCRVDPEYLWGYCQHKRRDWRYHRKILPDRCLQTDGDQDCSISHGSSKDLFHRFHDQCTVSSLYLWCHRLPCHQRDRTYSLFESRQMNL